MSASPILGRTFAVTRAAAQAGPLAALLSAEGAHALLAPAIAFAPPTDGAPLAAARAAAAGTWPVIVFTSTNGVDAFFRDGPVAAYQRAVAARQVRVAAVGAETARALQARGLGEVLTGATFVADALAEALLPTLAPHERVLFVRAEEGRETLVTALAGRVDLVAAYKTVPAEGPAAIAAALDAGRLDGVLFTAGSTVTATWAGLGSAHREHLRGGRVVLASIGPVTTAALRALGLPVAVEAEPHTAAGLVAALRRHFRVPQAGPL